MPGRRPDQTGGTAHPAPTTDAGSTGYPLGTTAARFHCRLAVPVPDPICAERERTLSLKDTPRRSQQQSTGGYTQRWHAGMYS